MCLLGVHLHVRITSGVCDQWQVVESFLSPAQRRMLDLVFKGDAENRNKVMGRGCVRVCVVVCA